MQGESTLLVIDDSDGRWIARSLGIKITGTIGLALLAVVDGELGLKRSIDDLISAGFRLSKKECEKIISGTKYV